MVGRSVVRQPQVFGLGRSVETATGVFGLGRSVVRQPQVCLD